MKNIFSWFSILVFTRLQVVEVPIACYEGSNASTKFHIYISKQNCANRSQHELAQRLHSAIKRGRYLNFNIESKFCFHSFWLENKLKNKQSNFYIYASIINLFSIFLDCFQVRINWLHYKVLQC